MRSRAALERRIELVLDSISAQPPGADGEIPGRATNPATISKHWFPSIAGQRLYKIDLTGASGFSGSGPPTLYCGGVAVFENFP